MTLFELATLSQTTGPLHMLLFLHESLFLLAALISMHFPDLSLSPFLREAFLGFPDSFWRPRE